MKRNPIQLLRWTLRARRSVRDAQQAGIEGLEFDRFGRGVGWRLLIRGRRPGLRLFLHPVDFLRYFEFSFAKSALPDLPSAACLDVSSPFIFSMHTAATRSGWSVLMTNPDEKDLAVSNTVRKTLRLGNVETARAYASAAAGLGSFDAIWSLSVIEHIPGSGDSNAMRSLYSALNPGGRLIVSVMTDKVHRDDFRAVDPYGLNATADPSTGVFFQRFYTEQTLKERLLCDGLVDSVEEICWFGESKRGAYDRRLGLDLAGYDYEWAVGEPIRTATEFRRFSTFHEMPGIGVCGFVLKKR